MEKGNLCNVVYWKIGSENLIQGGGTRDVEMSEARMSFSKFEE